MIKWPGLYMPPINLWNVPKVESEMGKDLEGQSTCINCRWWRKINSLIGECRRMPPHPADNVPDPRWWPATKREDWCGEFRKAGGGDVD